MEAESWREMRNKTLQERGKATSSHMRDTNRAGKRKTSQIYGYILLFFITGYATDCKRNCLCGKRYVLLLNSNNSSHALKSDSENELFTQRL